MPRPINIVLKGDYTDREVKKAIRDLQSLQTQSTKTAAAAGPTSKALSGIGASWKKMALGGLGALGATAIVGSLKDMGATAIEDQASVTKLSVALRNMGLASAQTGVEDFVKNTMLATGVTDDQLRPALARLLRSTESVEESQSGLGRALNISAATGKSLDVVTNALGKSYDGNAASLGRLGLGLDKALLKSGDMVAINAELDRKFGGQSAAAAETYAGKLLRVSTAADEAKESIGYGLLAALDDVGNAMGGTDGVVSLISQAGDELGDFARGLGESVAGVSTWLANVKLAGDETGVSLLDIGKAAYEAFPGVKAVSEAYGWLTDQGHDANQAEKDLNDEVNKSITLRHMYSLAIDEEAASTERLNDQLAANKKHMDHLSARSSVEAAIDAFGGLDTQGTKTWKDKHGKTHTSKTTKQFQTDWNSKTDSFNLGTDKGRQGWNAAKALIDATLNEASGEGPKRAAATYRYGRKSLVEQLSGIGVPKSEARAFARQNLATPPEITRQVNNNQKTTVSIDARGRSDAEINTIVNRVYRLAMIGTAPHGAVSAVDSTNVGRTSPMATDRGLSPAS